MAQYNDNYEPQENLAKAAFDVAGALHSLGNNHAATNLGAIENLAKESGEGYRAIAMAIEKGSSEIACAIRDLAVAISEK